VAEERKRRNSHVLEVLKKQQEERATQEAESGGDQPFPDLRSELGLGKSTTEGEQ
jgi:hypothetical protein